MTPAFYDEGHMLLRAHLKCLQDQTFKDFGVWLIDPHYEKRKDVIPEIVEHYGLNIVHVPYSPNPFIAKRLNCSIFNAVYCYSRTPRIVRLSCYRYRLNQNGIMGTSILDAGPQINLANANARVILGVLGYNHDTSGVLTMNIVEK